MVADVFTQTISGKMVSITNPKPEQIDINDMVYSLCRINRFNGHTKGIPYSVANHSWFAAKQAIKDGSGVEVALAVLLHDAHEYVIGDITTPAALAVQYLCGGLNLPNSIGYTLSKIKANIDSAIWSRLGLPNLSLMHSDKIRALDLRMLGTEKRDLLNEPENEYVWGHIKSLQLFEDKIVPIEPTAMFSLFYRDLTQLVSEAKR